MFFETLDVASRNISFGSLRFGENDILIDLFRDSEVRILFIADLARVIQVWDLKRV